MDNFRTAIPLNPNPIIDIDQSFVSLGSCFADSIGQRLLRFKWQGLVNPFGTIFHPFALFNILTHDAALPESLFLEHHGYSHHYWLPKTFFASSRSALQKLWDEKRIALMEELSKPGSLLLLTLGSAFLYEMDGKWVANCHQQPSRLFQKNLTRYEELLKAWEKTRASIPPHCKIIVTVSPVRHLKEGLIENSLSKSTLRLLAASMVSSETHAVSYFPAFEIMMDELRDYRFYEADMLHPTEQAIEFIWQRFQNGFMTDKSQRFIRDWQKILMRLEHRPLHDKSDEYKKFLSQLSDDLEDFSYKNIKDERNEISLRLSKANQS